MVTIKEPKQGASRGESAPPRPEKSHMERCAAWRTFRDNFPRKAHPKNRQDADQKFLHRRRRIASFAVAFYRGESLQMASCLEVHIAHWGPRPVGVSQRSVQITFAANHAFTCPPKRQHEERRRRFYS